MGSAHSAVESPLISFRGFQADCRGKETIMCFCTMASLRPFDKQPDMWPERADFNLLFPSARAKLQFIYAQDVFTDPKSAPTECKQPAKQK